MDSINVDMRSAPTFENLPTEIVEQIALYAGSNALENVTNLRSVSQTLQAKTRHAFIQIAFRITMMNFNTAAFRRLQNISICPSFGPAVESLHLRPREISAKEMANLNDAARHQEGDYPLRAQAIKDLWQAEESLREQSYIESTGIATAMLATALARLPNVKCISIYAMELEKPNARYRGSKFVGPGSTTIVASSVLAALDLCSIQLESFTIGQDLSMGFGHYQGMSTNALYFPERFYSTLFQNLKKLKLVLSHDESRRRTDSFLSEFLAKLPCLVNLQIVLDTFLSSESIMDEYLVAQANGGAKNALQHLHLEGALISIWDKEKFLTEHCQSLTCLKISNCNLQCKSGYEEDEDEDSSWTEILQQLKEFRSLRNLELYQLAEMDWRTCYPTQGIIEHTDLPESLDFDGLGWILLSKPKRYHVIVEEWEDMPTRLQELKDDFTVTEKDFRSDDRTPFAEHTWYEL